MSDTYAVIVNGLNLGDEIKNIEPRLVEAARIAINTTAAKGRTRAAEEIGAQINFPSGYLNPSTGRLVVSRQATDTSLEAAISARTRATSLARFAVGNTQPGARGGVSVSLKLGLARLLPRAFLIRLRSGSGLTETNNNLGLAVRTSGGPPSSAYKPKQIGPNLYLLYGPSVDQVFKGQQGRGVRDSIAPELEDALQTEFERQLARDNL